MTLQMVASGVALVAFILAFMVAPTLPAFAPLLAIGLLGVFVVQAPLCEPFLPQSMINMRTPACWRAVALQHYELSKEGWHDSTRTFSQM